MKITEKKQWDEPDKKVNKKFRLNERLGVEDKGKNGKGKLQFNAKETSRKGPIDGCLKCKGDHWLKHCPMATDDEKRKLLHAKRDTGRIRRVKRLQILSGDNNQVIVINDKLELSYCADSGADISAISRKDVEKLRNLDKRVILSHMDQPITYENVNGYSEKAHECVSVRIRIHTAAGKVTPLEIFDCLVIDGKEGEFILGNDILQSLGINVDHQLELPDIHLWKKMMTIWNMRKC